MSDDEEGSGGDEEDEYQDRRQQPGQHTGLIVWFTGFALNYNMYDCINVYLLDLI